jgi:uncharacterized cupin superfamily protein
MPDPSRPNVFATDVSYEEDDPEGYRAGILRPGDELGAKETGMSVYEIPPGQAVCPYHYERAEEEWLVVLEGTPTLRTPSGEEELARGDVAFFEPAPEGAHKISNRSEETARVVMFSSLRWPAVTVYPDSDKIGVYASRDRADNVIVPRSANVDYFDGEPLDG